MLLLLACTEPPAPPAPPADPATPPSASRPDLLLVTIDTLRADRVGAYGDALAATPNLDALAAQGALFREAHAVAPTTLPSHAAMLTGRWPAHTGVRDNGGPPLPADSPTLAAALSSAGYATAAFVSAYVLDDATGLDRGFALYRAPFSSDAARRAGMTLEVPGAKTVAAATAWWASAPAPRFAWVHLYDPHRPWPDGPGDPYRADVTAADAALGGLLAAADGALVMAVADHGESLWEHGERDHGLLVTRAATRVPLIVRPPGGLTGADAPPPRATAADVRRPPGVDAALLLDPVPDAPRAARVVPDVVSGLDVAATLADYAGVPYPSDGRSLRPLVEGRDEPPTPAYSETFYPLTTFGWSPRCAVQAADRRWHGPLSPHTTTDPADTTPGPDDPALAALAAERGCLDRPAAPQEADPRLLALGYLEGAGELPEGDLAAVDALRRAEEEPDPAEALAAYRALVVAHPRLWRARIGLAAQLAGAGDLAGALAELDTPGLPDTVARHAERGTLLLALGRLDDARATARHLQALSPRAPEGWQLEMTVALREKDLDDAERAARMGLDQAGEDGPLRYGLGLVLSARKSDAEALASFALARAAGSEAKDLDLQVALLHDRNDRFDEADAAYAAWRAVHEDDFRAWAAPAWMWSRAGRCVEALPLAEKALTLRPDDAGMKKVRATCRGG